MEPISILSEGQRVRGCSILLTAIRDIYLDSGCGFLVLLTLNGTYG